MTSTDTATTTTTIVPAADLDYVLTAVTPHAAKVDTIPVLTFVKLTARDGVATFAATDRFTIGKATIPWDGPDVDTLLPRSTVDAIAKLAKVEAKRRLPSGTPFVALTFDGSTVDVHAGDVRTTLPVDTRGDVGEFPRYESLFPTTAPTLDGAVIGLNPAHLAKFAKVDASKAPALKFTFYGATRAFTVEPTKRDDRVTFLGLVMPVRLA